MKVHSRKKFAQGNWGGLQQKTGCQKIAPFIPQMGKIVIFNQSSLFWHAGGYPEPCWKWEGHFLIKVCTFTTYGNDNFLSTENFVGKKQQGNEKNIIDFCPSIFKKKHDYK